MSGADREWGGQAHAVLPWAKGVSGIGSWFEFQARGSLGGWSAISSRPIDAYEAALATVRQLRDTLDQLPRRTAQLNDALTRCD